MEDSPRKKLRVSFDDEEDDTYNESDSFETSDTNTSPRTQPQSGSSQQLKTSPILPKFIRSLNSKSVVPEAGEQIGPKYSATDDNSFLLYEHPQLEERFSAYPKT